MVELPKIFRRTFRKVSTKPAPITTMAYVGLALSLVGVLYLGVLPSAVIDFAQASISTIF